MYYLPMEYGEFRRQLGKAGVTVREFAGLVGVRSASLTNYARAGRVPAHWAVAAALVAEMAECGLDFRPALARLGLAPKRPRGAALSGRVASPAASAPGVRSLEAAFDSARLEGQSLSPESRERLLGLAQQNPDPAQLAAAVRRRWGLSPEPDRGDGGRSRRRP